MLISGRLVEEVGVEGKKKKKKEKGLKILLIISHVSSSIAHTVPLNRLFYDWTFCACWNLALYLEIVLALI